MIFAAFTGLRWGELVALRVRDVDLDTGVVHVVRKFAELQNGERVSGRPKSEAGFRTLALPSVLVAVVREHLAAFPPSDPEDLIFKGAMGAALRRNNFHRSARWAECVAEAGLPEGFRFHDLRHTGNTLAASSGASTPNKILLCSGGCHSPRRIRPSINVSHCSADRLLSNVHGAAYRPHPAHTASEAPARPPRQV